VFCHNPLREDTLVLQLIPKGWLGWNFDVLNNDRTIAEFKTSTLPETGTFSIDGISYRAYREGMFSGDFFLESEGQTIGRAEKPSAFRSAFNITCADRTYTLKKESFVGRSFFLLEGDREVGSIRPEGVLTRKAIVSLPEVMPRPAQLFVLWLTILQWRREANAGAAGVAAAVASG
jgi:hypothetical protein